MKLYLKILALVFTLAVSRKANAQQHNLTPPTNCRFAKGPVPANFVPCPACAKDKEKEKESRKEEDKERELAKPKYGALAIDKKKGFYYGWSYDQPTRATAEQRAITECNNRGGSCTLVLSFSGAGCAAYRTISTGTAYGWGIAATRQEADAIALRECLKRSNGVSPGNYVWSCNSTTKAPLREIFNAIDELDEIPFTGPLGATQALALSPDGTRMLTGSKNKCRLWTYPGCKLLAEITADGSYVRKINGVVFSPDGSTFVLTDGNTVKQWNAKTGKLIRTFGKHEFETPALAFSPDGTLLASGGEHRTDALKVWNVATGELIRTIKEHEFGIRATSFSPDNRYVATVSVDGTAKIWNLSNWQSVRTFKANYEQLMDGGFSPDGQTFITVAFDGDKKVKLWDVSSGNLIKTLGTLSSYGYSVNYYLGNDKAISTDMDSRMILWDLSSGARLAEVGNVEYWQSAIAPDGSIVTAGAGGLQIWNLSGNRFTLVKKL
jgi:WD40 repeat protein